MAEPQRRHTVVTGATSGIGQATATRFAQDGDRLTLTGRNLARAESVTAEIMAHGAEACLWILGDAASPQHQQELADKAAKLPPISNLILNAATLLRQPLLQMTPEAWQEILAVNVAAPVQLVAALKPALAPGASIVLVASAGGVHGVRPFPEIGAYAASKAAVIKLAEALALELKPEQIRVNAVSPGAVETPMLKQASETALSAMSAAEVAETIHYLCSAAARPINGKNINVFGV